MLNKKIFYFVFILLIIFIMILPPSRKLIYNVVSDFYYPFMNLALTARNNIKKKSITNKSKSFLINEIYDLQRINSELSAASSHLNTILEENNELRKLLDLKKNPGYSYIFAQVLFRDPIEWFTQFTINKGYLDGIEQGAVVVAKTDRNKNSFGVVGRISSASKHTAMVDTIISNECNISVYIPSNGATGILSGGKRDSKNIWSKVSYLPRDLTYAPSSIVVTSGLNKLTPPDLFIGKIMDLKYSPISVYNNLFIEAKIRPVVDLNHLNFILVFVKKK